MSKPLISVISIIYMVKPYLKECLESLKALTYPELELILVVGQKELEEKDPEGNNLLTDDGCLALAEEFARDDGRFRIVKCIASGVGDARNRGLNAAKGQYIGFVDGDDYVDPGMFDRLLYNIRKYEADISVCGKYFEYPDMSIREAEEAEPLVMQSEEAAAMLMDGSGFSFHCWDKLFKAEMFDGIRFPEDKYLEDRYVVGNLLLDAERIVYDRTPMYHFRVRTDSVSHYRRMSELNSDADTVFAQYAVSRFPGLSLRAEAFLLYGHITCIQNALAEGYYNREEEEKHFAYVRKHRDSALHNAFVNTNTRVKVFLTLHALFLLKLLTLYSKKKQGARRRFTKDSSEA